MPHRAWPRRLLLVGLAVIVGGLGVVGGSVLVPQLGGIGLVAGTTPAPSSSAGAPASPSAAPSGSALPGTSPVATAAPTPSRRPVASPSPSPSASPSPSSSPIPIEALDRRLATLQRRLALPGVSVTIRWTDGRTWTGVAGLADIEAGVPVTADTGFALASVSKTYTAALALRLEAAGRLELDDPVRGWLPAIEIDRRITVRMLLEHTSGLPDYFLNPRIDKPLRAKPDDVWSVARTMGFVGRNLFQPGTGWHYSNTNYLLLGLVVEVAGGRPLAEQVRAELLEPLGLEATWFQIAEPPPVAIARGYRLVGSSDRRVPEAVPEDGDIMPFRSVVSAARGAGSIAATSTDAARWLEALLTGDVLDPATVARMVGEARVTTDLGARIPYGYGLQVVPLADRPSIGHSGRFMGFRTIVRHLPTEGLTIAVLTNQSTLDPTRVAESLLDLVLPAPEPSPSSPPSGSVDPGSGPSASPS